MPSSTLVPVKSEDILPGINPASRHDPDLAWFREARLGMFILFGLWAGVTHTEHGQYGFGDGYREYEALAKTWNPSALDVEQRMEDYDPNEIMIGLCDLLGLELERRA
jgi:hypothetical protein